MNSIARDGIGFPFTYVGTAIVRLPSSIALFSAVKPLALVLVAISPFECAFTVRLVQVELASVSAAVWVDLEAFASSFVLDPAAFVDTT